MKTITLYTLFFNLLGLFSIWCPQGLGYIFNGSSSVSATNKNTGCSSEFTLAVDTTTKVARISQVPSPSSCSTRNLDFISFFATDSVPSSTFLVADSSKSVLPYWFASFRIDQISFLNGTACLYLPQTKNLNNYLYLCSFVSDGLTFYVEMFSTIKSPMYPITFPNPMVSGYTGNPNQTGEMTTNSSFLPVPVDLYPTCTSNKTIDSIYTYVYFRLSKNALSMFTNMSITYVIVRSKTTNEYRTVNVSSKYTAYSRWGYYTNDSCVYFGVYVYNMIAASNSTFCSKGCDVSFLLTNPQTSSIYTLQTTGIVYVPPPEKDYTSSSSDTYGDGPLDGMKILWLTMGLPFGIVICVIIITVCCICAKIRRERRREMAEAVALAGLSPMERLNRMRPRVPAPPPPLDDRTLLKVRELESNPTQTTLVNPQEIGVQVLPLPPPSQAIPSSGSQVRQVSGDVDSDGEDSPMVGGRTRQPPPPAYIPAYIPQDPAPEGGPRLAPALSGPLDARPKNDVVQPCVVCNSQTANVFFSPCEHVVCCQNCDSKLLVCPVCGVAIENKMNVTHPTPDDYKKVMAEEAYRIIQNQVEVERRPVCFSCLSREVNRVALPCGHLFACANCIQNHDKCMVCNADITSKRPVRFK